MNSYSPYTLNNWCLRALGALLLIVTSALMHACSDARTLAETGITYDVGGPTMGTRWSASWVADSEQDSLERGRVQQALENELARINALMSTWDPASELSLFNASQSVESVELHADTLKVIDAALPISRLTSGRYDITLKPIIELWGFSRDTVTPTPTDNDITAALAVSGHNQLVRIGNTIRKRKPAISIDVSSLAKGYAVDQLGEVLEAAGITRYLIDIGGELRARGTRADGLVWRVGIENPEGYVPQIINLNDAHVATSGSYRNYRMENGKRLSHIIDGATGKPIEHDVASVSVVHESTMLADAWATALLVVGEVDALRLVNEQALKAQLTLYRNGRFERISSPAFDALLVQSD